MMKSSNQTKNQNAAHTAKQPIPRAVSGSDSGEDYMDAVEDSDEEEFLDAVEEEQFFDTKEEDQKYSPRTSTPTTCQSNSSIPFHNRLGHLVDCVHLSAPEKKTHLQKTFAYQHLFGDRLVMYKINLTKNQGKLPRNFEEPSGHQYELLCSKFEKKKEANIPRKILTLYYVLVEGPGVVAMDLREDLDKIANWGSLPPSKIPSRLELLFSTAVKGKGRDGLAIDTELSSCDDIEMIEENSHVGCGFIPREYIERFLGRTARGTRTFAIQVRIFSAELGIFKGMLMEKPGITKIQLPPSMQKVGPTKIDSSSNERASILINNVYPSSVHIHVSNILNGTKEPPISFVPNKLKWMVASQFQSLGVTKESMEQYADESHSRRGQGLQHSSVVGVADPTNSIPQGHVFVTGALGTNAELPELFVTRFPCTEAHDGMMLPLVTRKPDDMAHAHWNFLCNLPFGAIVFGNPLFRGEPSLPSMIARGDLDGDNYFVCWNKELLHQIQPLQPAEGEFDDGVLQMHPHKSGWLRDTQFRVCAILPSFHFVVVTLASEPPGAEVRRRQSLMTWAK